MKWIHWERDRYENRQKYINNNAYVHNSVKHSLVALLLWSSKFMIKQICKKAGSI